MQRVGVGRAGGAVRRYRTDEAGAELRATFSQRGIHWRTYSVADRRPTTVKLRIVAHDQQIVRIDEEDTAPIDGRLADEVVSAPHV